MAAATGSRRRKAEADRAAKQRRQVILAGVLGAVLLIVLLLELPKLLKSSSSSSSSSGVPLTSPTTTPSATSSSAKQLRALLRQPPRDVFTPKGAGEASTLGSVSTPPGLHDPFASPSTPAAAVAPPVKPTITRAPTLPGKIVIGTPGAGKVAVTGWIVILASIPTAQGQIAATSFAAQAAKNGVGKTSVLNSSNRRPLRGGFWVVYTGPYTTLTEVSSAADNVHKSGFRSAYIRQLIVYKKKTATKKK